MSFKLKFTKEERIKICEEYKSGSKSFSSIARLYEIDKETLRSWYYTYEAHGESALDHVSSNRSYTHDYKIAIINEYILGNTSACKLAIKYNTSKTLIFKWLKKYYNGIELKDYDPKGEIYTMKSRKTTTEEALEIVKWVIATGMD